MAFTARIALFVFVMAGLRAPGAWGQVVSSQREAIRRALGQSLVLRGDSFQIGFAQAGVVTAGLRPNPVLTLEYLQVGDRTQAVPGFPFISAPNQQQWNQLGKRMQIAGLRPNKIAVASAEADLARRRYGFDRQQITYQVALEWADLWYAHMVRQNLAEQHQAIGRIKASTTLTPDDRGKLAVVEGQLALFENDAEQQVLLHTRDLRLLLNTRDSLDPRVEDPLAGLPRFENLDSLVAEARRHNPSLAVARQELTVAERQLSLQRSLAWPTPEAGVLFNPQGGVPYAGAYLVLPISAFDRNQGNRERARLGLAYAQNALALGQTQTELGVELAYGSLRLQRGNRARTDALLASSEQVLTTAEADLRAGRGNLQDYLVLLQTWYETKVLQDQVGLNLRIAVYDLLRALGRLDLLVD